MRTPGAKCRLGRSAVRRREGLTGGVAGFFQRPFVEIDAMAGAYFALIAAPEVPKSVGGWAIG